MNVYRRCVNRQVIVDHYYVRCMADYCSAALISTETESETKAAVCQTLETYSRLCASRFKTFSWRTDKLCRELIS